MGAFLAGILPQVGLIYRLSRRSSTFDGSKERGNDQEIDHFIIIKIVSQFIHHSKFTALQVYQTHLTLFGGEELGLSQLHTPRNRPAPEVPNLRLQTTPYY
jgi:hypothetical protein